MRAAWFRLIGNGSVFLSALAALLVNCGAARAQIASDPQADTGTRSSGTYEGLHDHVSLSSGNLSFCIPLLSLPGRNKHDLNIPLCYNSQFMESQPVGPMFSALSWFPWVWGSNTAPMGPGWTLTGRPGVASSTMETGTNSPVLTMPDGSRYDFPSSGCGSVPCGPDSQMANAYITQGTQIIFFRDGTNVRGSIFTTTNQVYDTSGNHIDFQPSSVTDTVGRVVNVNAADAVGSSPAHIAFQYPDPSGTNQTVTATVQVTPINFTCTGGTNFGATGTYAMPSAVILANGTSYTFQYDTCGLLTKITYPAGGYTRYDYAMQNFKQLDAAGTNHNFTPVNEISHKYVCPAAVGPTATCSVQEEVTTYAPVTDQTFNNSQMTVTDPIGNYTVYQFAQGIPGAFTGVNTVETSRASYDGQGKFYSSVQTQYANVTQSGCPSLPSVQTTTLDNGKVSQVKWTYDCYNPATKDTVLTQKQEYDFGQGAPGPLLRTTTYTWLHRDNEAAYGWPGNSNSGNGIVFSTGANILDRKSSESIYDGSGTLVAKTKYVYDYGAPSTYGAAGSLTSQSRWKNTDNTWLTQNYVYGQYGNLASAQDANGNTTYFDYADNYSDGVNRSTQAYRTKTTSANGLYTQTQYSWASGNVVATCGENFSGTCKTALSSVPDYTSLSYDNMNRVIASTMGDGGSSTICRSDQSGSPCYSGSLPRRVFTTEAIATGTTKTTTSVLDGLGRTTQTQLTSDPSCSSGTLVDTSYDLDERISTRSTPYCSKSDPTYGITATAYDGIGRIVKVTNADNTFSTSSYTGRAVLTADEGNGTSGVFNSRIAQSDVMGRLIYVCELSATTQQGNSNNTPIPCGLDAPGSGFLTTYGYDTLGNVNFVSQGAETRSFVFDSLSRLRTATNPESGSLTYTYDSNGNLSSKHDARNITTTYGYDNLNRLTLKTYSDNVTPSSCFQYDTGATRGSGRMTAEWTQSGACPATLPSSGVLTKRTIPTYDLMGRVLTDQQCATPGNCSGGSAFSVNYNYDLAGDVVSSTNGLTSSMTFSNNYDSAGRISTIQGAVSGTTPVSLFAASSYTPAGAVSSAVIGPQISMHRDYDARLRPTAETDTVASTPGTASVQITGSEQLFAFSQGSITFSGFEKSTTVNGGLYYDGGLFLISINGGNPIQLNYGQNSTPQTLAAAAATQFNCSYGPVQAVAIDSTVFFVSCSPGSNNTYSLSAKYDGNDFHFPQPSFSVTASGSSMTQSAALYSTPTNTAVGTVEFAGNEQSSLQNGATTYDTGYFTLIFWPTTPPSGPPTKNQQITWGQGTTTQSLAASLASSFTSCASGSPISASQNGSVVALANCQPNTNYSLFMAVSHSGSMPASFAAQLQSYFVNAENTADVGTAVLTINGTQVATTSYSSTSTPASIVSGLVSAGSNNSLVNLAPSSADPTFLQITGKGGGANQNYTYALNFTYDTAHFAHSSFASPGAAGSLQGGQSVPLYSWQITGYAPDGDVLTVTDSVMGGWTHAYDDLNRLVNSKGVAGAFLNQNLTWDYDRYGNRWDQTSAGPRSGLQEHFTFTSNNNRIDGRSYDVVGNLLSDGATGYTYDAENRITAINGQLAYIYDATGARVAKVGASGALTAVYILNTSGQQVTELNGSGSWQHSNAYNAGGRLLATYTPGGGYHYNLTDWLGTKRLQTNSSGNQEETCMSYPFGDNLTCSGTDATEQHFTGKDRDTDTGLDYFGARYLSSNFGRFMSADWAASPTTVPYAQFGNPQSLNLYSYVGNNPNTGVDVNGHCGTLVNSSTCPPSSQASWSGGNYCASWTICADLPDGSYSGGGLNWNDAWAYANSLPTPAGDDAAQQQGVTADVKGQTVTYTYPDGSTVTRHGSHAWRDNNPGDEIGGYGSIDRDSGGGNVMAVYPSEEAGWNALQQNLTNKYGPSSILETMSHFASNKKKGDNPEKYAADLAIAVGASVSTKVSQLSSAQFTTLMVTIARKEGYFDAGNTITYSAISH